MALLICLDCTAAFAVGVRLCPQCGSERSVEQGTDPYRGGTMPKINAAGEATYAADIPDTEGGEGPSQPTTPGGPGTGSSTSPEKQSTSQGTSSAGPRKRARATGSRSKKTAGPETSSAGSTGTGGPETAGTEQD